MQPVTNRDRKAKGQFGNITYTLTDGQQFVIYGCHLHKTELTTDIGKRVFKRVVAAAERGLLVSRGVVLFFSLVK